MIPAIEYGVARVRDIQVHTRIDPRGKRVVEAVALDGRRLEPTARFWSSLHCRFGFTANIFRYFRHDEVFERISEVAPNDRLRWSVQRDADGQERLLAVSNPAAAVVPPDELCGLLERYGVERLDYDQGVVTSRHAPRMGGSFQIAGDAFQNKFVIDTPIDGFGRPAVYLSLLRLVCANGAVAQAAAFRSEINVGRGGDQTEYALVRVLEGFNNDEGYAALRQRFESAAESWASVQETQRLYKLLVRLHHGAHLRKPPRLAGDGASEVPAGASLLRAFDKLTGDLSQVYGLANLDALSAKRQRTLPAACKVYDLLNFASETATHHASPAGAVQLHAYLGDLLAGEFDLEGTAQQFADWQDFFIGHEQTTGTLAALHRR